VSQGFFLVAHSVRQRKRTTKVVSEP